MLNATVIHESTFSQESPISKLNYFVSWFYVTCQSSECNMSFIRRLFGGSARKSKLYDSKYPFSLDPNAKSDFFDNNFPTFNRQSNDKKYYKNTSTNTEFFVDQGVNCDIPKPLVYHRKRPKKTKTQKQEIDNSIEPPQKILEIDPISNAKPEILKSFQDDFLYGVETIVPTQKFQKPIIKISPNPNKKVENTETENNTNFVKNLDSSMPELKSIFSKLKFMSNESSDSNSDHDDEFINHNESDSPVNYK